MYKGDKKDIGAIALYINSELKKGRTQKEIEIIDFNVNERVIEKRLKRNGYKKINNEYVKPSILENKKDNDRSMTSDDKSMTDVVVNKEYVNLNDITKSEKVKEVAILYNSINKNSDDKSMTNIIRSDVLEKKLIDLLSNYDKLKNIIDRYDNDQIQEHKRILIELPLDNEKDFRTTIRVNKSIWNEFNKFSEKNREFNKKDLLSMALKEYIENHKD